MDNNTIRELTIEGIVMVDGGKADFSRVTARVTSTAEIVYPDADRARLTLLWSLLR